MDRCRESTLKRHGIGNGDEERPVRWRPLDSAEGVAVFFAAAKVTRSHHPWTVRVLRFTRLHATLSTNSDRLLLRLIFSETSGKNAHVSRTSELIVPK